MKSASAIRLGLASLVTACALLSIAATPPRKQPEAYTFQVIAIDGNSVRVSPLGKGSGAELRLLLRKEAEPALKDSLTQLKLGRVRILDGGTLVTEARLSGIIGGDRDKLVGLVLSFKTLDEANKVARAPRVSPLRDETGSTIGRNWSCAHGDQRRQGSAHLRPCRPAPVSRSDLCPGYASWRIWSFLQTKSTSQMQPYQNVTRQIWETRRPCTVYARGR